MCWISSLSSVHLSIQPFFYHLSCLSTYLSIVSLSSICLPVELSALHGSGASGPGSIRSLGTEEKAPALKASRVLLGHFAESSFCSPVTSSPVHTARSLWPHWCVIVTSEARPHWPPTQRIGKHSFSWTQWQSSHFIKIFGFTVHFSHMSTSAFSSGPSQWLEQKRVPVHVNCHHWFEHDLNSVPRPHWGSVKQEIISIVPSESYRFELPTV